MATIGLFCAEEEARRDLALAIEELGHRVAWASTLRDALALLPEERPRLVVVASGPRDRTAEALLGELETAHPLLPVVVALTRRDALRAVELLKAGAAEVVAPPWTRESLAACVSKGLRLGGTAFGPQAPPRGSRRLLFGLSAAAVLAALAGGYALLRGDARRREAARAAPRTEWELPYAHPSGVACRDGELWVADWYSQGVFRHDPESLAVRRSLHMPAVVPVTLALFADALWTVSARGGILRHMLDERLTVLARYPNAYPHTVGMAYDGLYLWTADTDGGRLRKRLLDDQLTVLESYDYPGSKPAALAYDGRDLWSLDAGNRELLRHDLQDPRKVSYRRVLREYQSGNWRPAGLAWDGRQFWSVAEPARPGARGGAAGRLFRHPAKE